MPIELMVLMKCLGLEEPGCSLSFKSPLDAKLAGKA